MAKKKKPSKRCPSCAGRGTVCCPTWAYVRASSGPDLEFNELRMPLWPFIRDFEIPRCPWCGQKFKPDRDDS